MQNENDNYFIFNNMREQIELKHIIQTKYIFGFKKRYVILTSKRILIFKDKNSFLLKKNPKVFKIKLEMLFTSGL